MSRGLGDVYKRQVYLCAGTYRTEGQTINLLILLEWITGKLDAYIAQGSRVVSIICAAMLGTRTALYLLLSLVVLSLTAENDTTPVARLSAAGSLF